MIELMLVSLAFGQEEVEVVGDRASPSDTPSAVTVIEVDDALSSSVDVADAISLAPGAVVHRLGGLGSWSSVSIRGSTGRQVEVFLEGVPLNPEGSSTFDLSQLPLRAFERLEVYRGSAPPRLGSTAIGGAVNLVPRTSGLGTASLAAGSLGTIRASGAVGGEDYLVYADGFRTDGDFTWFDDRSTLFETSDDRFRRRMNNDKAQGSVLGRVVAGGDRLGVRVLNVFTLRNGGVPGFTFAPTETVRLGSTRELLSVQAHGTTGSLRSTGSVFGMIRQDDLDDRAGEIGVGRRLTSDLGRSLGGRATVDWAASSSVGLFGAMDLRQDLFTHRDRLSDTTDPARLRRVGRGTAALTWAPLDVGLVVLPSMQIIGTDRAEVAPQLGFRCETRGGWVVKGNAGRYVRVPDLLELYGDRGAIKGNADLRSEVGLNADLGVQGRAEGRLGWVQVEGVGFWSLSRDRIVYVQNAQGVALPLNLQNARIGGVEGAVTVAVSERVESSTQLTWTQSRNLDSDPAYAGKQLPRIPAWELHQRTGLVWRSIRVGHRVDFADGNYWDLTNWFRSAPRHLHGVFARVTSGSWSVEADVLNLADRIVETVPLDPLAPEGVRVDQPVTDFAGYPLPGRTFLLTMRWQG